MAARHEKTSSFVLCGPRFYTAFSVRIRQTSYAQGRFRQYHRKSQRRQIGVDERGRTPFDHHLKAQTTATAFWEWSAAKISRSSFRIRRAF